MLKKEKKEISFTTIPKQFYFILIFNVDEKPSTVIYEIEAEDKEDYLSGAWEMFDKYENLYNIVVCWKEKGKMRGVYTVLYRLDFELEKKRLESQNKKNKR